MFCIHIPLTACSVDFVAVLKMEASGEVKKKNHPDVGLNGCCECGCTFVAMRQLTSRWVDFGDKGTNELEPQDGAEGENQSLWL